MKKVFLDDLPRFEIGRCKGKINWMSSIGYMVKFIYDDIEGELPILDVVRKNGSIYIMTEYGDCKDFSIASCSFIKGAFGELLGTCTKKYTYNDGDIIVLDNGKKIEILEQIRISHGKRTEKGYKYRCLVCGNIDTKMESSFERGQGCNVCSGKKILIGFNDMWTTHSQIAKLLKYPEIGYVISFGSDKKQIFICPDCGSEKEISPITLIRHGLACPKCSDGISYPNKFVFGILSQLNIKFKTEEIFDWAKDKRYDFYIPSMNIIIEANGVQHYDETTRGRSLKEEFANDELKGKLALKNGIESEKYIPIDCRESEMKWIKGNVLDSNLVNFFDLSNINWVECHKYACKSLVETVCNLWNEGLYDTKKIGEVLKLSKPTVISFLKKGKETGICSYDAKEELRKCGMNTGGLGLNKKKVICVTTNKIFDSLTMAGKSIEISDNGIRSCCRGRNKSAGKHPITGEKLVWMYYDEYLKLQEII